MASRLISCSARSRRPEPALLAPGLHSIARVDGRRCLKWWCGVRGLQAFGEPGAIVYLADCVNLIKSSLSRDLGTTWTCVGSVDRFRLRTVRGKESIATNKPDLPTGVSPRSYPAGQSLR